MSIQTNLHQVLTTLPTDTRLVAISKTMTEETVMQAYNAGQRLFGENKVQEIIEKQPHLPKDIEWHFVGHLQRNKVKFIAPFVSMIHAVDSLRLLKEINKQAERNERIIHCLLQFHIADESTKFGLDMAEAEELLNELNKEQLPHIRLCGVMGMATFTEDHTQVRKEFKQLRTYFDYLKNTYFKDDDAFKEISMGMSGDYLIALEEGATIVRIGSTIFGERNY